MTIRRHSHSHLASKVRARRLSATSANTAVRETMRAIRATLKEGYPVTLPMIGRIHFGFRKGRTAFGKHQPDSYPIKFKASPHLQKLLRGSVPKQFTKPKGKGAKKI